MNSITWIKFRKRGKTIMTTYNEIEGNLITLAKEGKFDVIAHGCK